MKLLLFVLLPIACEDLFAKTIVSIQIGSVQATSCAVASETTFICGSVGNIAVIVSSDTMTILGKPGEFPSQAPDWLLLEASYKESTSDSFIASAELLDLLRPNYFRTREQENKEVALKIGDQMGKLSNIPAYNFTIQLPDELAGKKICVRAVLAPPPYGQLSRRSKTEVCASIVAPCSEDDRNLAAAAHIIYANREGNFQRAVHVADSLIEIGWRSQSGLAAAFQSASALGQYDKSIRFLDLEFDSYGTVLDQLSTDPEKNRNQYIQFRSALLNARANQK